MGNDERGDAELLAAGARGDGSAFGILVRRHIRPATLLAAQILGDRDDAEDIVQDSFTVVLERARAFDATRPFPPWLFGIVRRLAQHRRARIARRARLLRLWGKGTVVDPEPVHIEPALVAGADLEIVRQAMRSLSPMQRACFELVTVRDLSPAEVGVMHDISESTVRQHVFRARQSLRKALNPEGAND